MQDTVLLFLISRYTCSIIKKCVKSVCYKMCVNV